MIDPKYCSKSMTVLSDEEKIREAIKPKVKFAIDLFEEDLKLAQTLNINISRIIRFKFHEWLESKLLQGEIDGRCA